MKYIIALLFIVLILGCISATNQAVQNATNTTSNVTNISALVVANGSRVAVDYTGTFENGTVFDSSIGRTPLEFVAGAGQMIKGFDAAVIGMHEGEEKTVTIKPEDAYGLHDPSNIYEVLIENIPNDTKVGDTLLAGGVQPVLVLELGNTTAKIDANHPLAGKTLIFKIKIVKIYP